MKIKNNTLYSSELVKEFLRLYYNEKIKSIRIILNILVLIMIIRFFILDDITTSDIITFICGLLIIIELNTNLLPSINYKRLERSKNSILNININYLFKEHNFMIKTDKEEYINYKDLYKVIERTNCYYLYINKYKAFIVDKKDIKDSDIEKLTINFKNKVSTYKYIK